MVTTRQSEDGIIAALREEVFEFADQAAPIFRLLGWSWGNDVPHRRQIEDKLEGLIDKLEASMGSGHENLTFGTGGIEVEVYRVGRSGAWEGQIRFVAIERYVEGGE